MEDSTKEKTEYYTLTAIAKKLIKKNLYPFFSMIKVSDDYLNNFLNAVVLQEELNNATAEKSLRRRGG